MTTVEELSSGWATGVSRAIRTLVEPAESIGTPLDPPATDVADANSAFSLLKGILANLNVSAGSGDVNDVAKLYPDPLATLGQRSDAVATGTGRHTLIAMLKGIVVRWT